MLTALALKKALTLVALVDPFLLVPLYLKLSSDLGPVERRRYAASLGVAVLAVLAGSALLGPVVFGLLGLSMAGLQITGALVLFLMGFSMLLGRELSAKQTQTEAADIDRRHARLVPLAVPLLAGPASISFVMSSQAGEGGALDVLVACAAAGLVVWLTFRFAQAIGERASVSVLGLVERLAGLLVTSMAVDMLGAGMKQMFPGLAV